MADGEEENVIDSGSWVKRTGFMGGGGAWTCDMIGCTE